ncbi:MAG: hypothetical protein SGJ27_29150, partial [Candidatus Melainabacteria bacterium]|nr:hypothetical protein [Candidatus Melainabacteria bacterium]
LLNWVLVLQPKPYQASPGGDHQTFQLNSGQGLSLTSLLLTLVALIVFIILFNTVIALIYKNAPACTWPGKKILSEKEEMIMVRH